MKRLRTRAEAAKELGICVKTVDREIKNGFTPAVVGRGRGNQTLVDVDALKEWRGCSSHGLTAEQVSELAADGAWRALQMTDDPRIRRAVAGWLIKAWYFTAAAAYEREGRIDEPAVPDRIEHMRGMEEK